MVNNNILLEANLNLSFEKATINDFEKVKDIYLNNRTNNEINFKSVFENGISENNSLNGLYTLRSDGQILAVVNLSSYRWQCEHAATINELLIDDKFFGSDSKITMAILQKIESIAVENGIKRIDSTFSSEASILPHYKDAGFHVEATRQSSIKDDDYQDEILLGKVIDPKMVSSNVDFQSAVKVGKASRSATENASTSEFFLRKAKAEEFDTIKAIYRNPAATPFLYGNTDADFVQLFKERVSEKVGISGLYVLENKDKVIIATVNLAKLGKPSDHVLYIGGVAVKQCEQRGVGTELLKNVEIIAKQNGISRLELEVEADNPRAIGLYSKVGFEVEGVKHGFVKRANESHYTDEVQMAKLI